MAIFFEKERRATIIFAKDEYGEESCLGSMTDLGTVIINGFVVTTNDLRKIIRRREFESDQITCDCCGMVSSLVSETEITLNFYCQVCARQFSLKKDLIADR